ncbi:MAG TPA: ABC transporter substrate-binding protein, partial [Acidimicrobiia bacterium]|nr:ABC transporter substrate-binding protein [Acidimicrobiia bacterium]
MHRFRWLAVAAVAALGVSTVAVAPATARTRAQSNGISGDEIKVAGVVDAQAPDTGIGAQARFDEENAKGGVFGRKIKLVEMANDNGDPTQDEAAVKRLVQQDGVAAIVPVQSVVFQGGTFLAQQRVPFFGWGISTQFFKNPYGFGFTGPAVTPSPVKSSNTSWAGALDAMFRAQGDPNGAKGKTVALIAEENDSGVTGLEENIPPVKAYGMKIVYQKASIPFATPPSDYTPFVNQLLTSNNGKAPDVIIQLNQVNVVIGLSRALNEAGYTGVDTNAVLYDPRAVGIAKNQVIYTQFDVPEDTANPNMQKVVTALENAGLGTATKP